MVFTVRSAPADAWTATAIPFRPEAAVMEKGVRAVDEILEVAVDIIIIRRRSYHEDLACQHLFSNATPVISLVNAPFLLDAFPTAKTGKDLLAGEGDKFRLDPGIPALPEDHLYQLCSVSLLSHTA